MRARSPAWGGAVALGTFLLAALLLMPHVAKAMVYGLGVFSRAPHAGGCVALTFDDGPDPRFTPLVLDMLAEHDAKATFFVVGEQVSRHPDLAARILAEGHEIGHHSNTHRRPGSLTAGALEDEFDSGLLALTRHDVAPVWYRPPRKELCARQRRLAAERGMRVALWTRSIEREWFRSPEQAAATILAEVEQGDVLLGHDGRLDRTMTVGTLSILLDGLADRGLRSVTLSDLRDRHEGSRR